MKAERMSAASVLGRAFAALAHARRTRRRAERIICRLVLESWHRRQHRAR